MTQNRKGYTILIVVFLLLLFAFGFVGIHVVATTSLALTTRSADIAVQNSLVAERIEKSVAEAAQGTAGVSASPITDSFGTRLSDIFGKVPSGAAIVEVLGAPTSLAIPLAYPQIATPPTDVTAPSAELLRMADPGLRHWLGDVISEGTTATVSARFKRPSAGGETEYTYPVSVNVKAVSIPVTRWGIFAYDLPTEIAATSGTPITFPSSIATSQIAPQGLAPLRDSARVMQLESGSNRPGYYRRLAAASEAIQATFTDKEVQTLSDYAGSTHWVQIGRGGANPVVAGGVEYGTTYTLDIGAMGVGTFGTLTLTKDIVVIVGTGPADRVELTDSGGGSGAVVVVLIGPAASTSGRLDVSIQNSITRPCIIRGYNVAVRDVGGRTISGALILDPPSTIEAPTSLFTLGSLVYWGGSGIDISNVRLGAMPAAAQRLAPRVVLFATERSAF